MWLILLTCNCLYWLTCGSSWILVNPILGEQVDLVDGNESFTAGWTKSAENDETKDALDSFVANDAFNSTRFPFNSIDRDRDLMDEVERIEPRHWPVRPDILYTRANVPSTTEPLPRRPLNPSTFARRNSSTQRYESQIQFLQTFLKRKKRLTKLEINLFRFKVSADRAAAAHSIDRRSFLRLWIIFGADALRMAKRR